MTPAPSPSATVLGTKTSLPATGSAFDLQQVAALGASLIAAGTAVEVTRRKRAAATASVDASDSPDAPIAS